MKTQQDTQVRLVALENLRVMCAAASGVCHRFWIDKVSRSRVHVAYSNPDEYGTERPMVAVFPCFPSDWPYDADNPRVVLEMLRVIGAAHWHGEGWQAFQPLLDTPTLWRHPDSGTWQTEAEIQKGSCPKGETDVQN